MARAVLLWFVARGLSTKNDEGDSIEYARTDFAVLDIPSGVSVRAACDGHVLLGFVLPKAQTACSLHKGMRVQPNSAA